MTRKKHNRLHWSTFCALTLVTAALTFGSSAHADHHMEADTPKWDFGLFGGFHWTSENNELGVADTAMPDAFDNSWGLGIRLGYAIMEIVSAEAEVAFLPTDTIVSKTDVMPIAWRVHALVHFLGTKSKIRPFAVAGVGGLTSAATNIDVLDKDTDFAWHAGLGFKLMLGDRWGVRVDGRAMFPPSSEDSGVTVDYELWAGLTVLFGGSTGAADADGDGVPDADDKCPEQAETMNGIEDEDGCPEEADADGDGITGAADKCPNDAEDKDGFEDDDGCPDPDNDKDGIPDASDQCKDQAETVNGIEDEDGCPETDEDGDGVVGSADKCPADAEDKDGFEDDDGCPDPDNDKDGVVDAQDGCPTEAGPVENRGCPDTDKDGDGVVDRLDNCPEEAGTAKNYGCKKKQLVKLVGTKLEILDKVYFASGRAKIRRRSNRLLDNVARVIIAQSSIPKIVVEGHTDAQGADDKNKELSQKRAQAVVDYLVKKGVKAERLEAIGYGEEKPIDSNDTRAGRANNRRVEFNIVNAPPKEVPVEDAPAPAPAPAGN